MYQLNAIQLDIHVPLKHIQLDIHVPIICYPVGHSCANKILSRGTFMYKLSAI